MNFPRVDTERASLIQVAIFLGRHSLTILYGFLGALISSSVAFVFERESHDRSAAPRNEGLAHGVQMKLGDGRKLNQINEVISARLMR